MTALTNQKIQASYGDLLQVSNSNAGVDSTLRNISSGLGNNAAVKISTTALQATGTFNSVGAGTFSSTLGVTGATSLDGALTVTGTTTLNGNLVLSSALSPSQGGTGVANNSANTLTFTGNYSLGVTLSGNTSVTLPTSGTLVNTGVTTLSSLSTVGTITSGTWNGGAIGVTYGGTGQTSYTNGQLLIGNTTGNTLTKATLTAGTGISITNGAGSITVSTAVANPTITQVTQQVFTSSGTYTPTPGMKYCMVEVVGGGAGGGAGGASVYGGGGAGGYARIFATATDVGASKTVTIGAGGGSNTAGGTTTLQSILSATGGTTGSATAGGAGGTGSGGFSIPGGQGDYGFVVTGFANAGRGGHSQFGHGGPGSQSSGANGVAGNGYGAGGGGAWNSSGGAGTSGVVVITEFLSV